jgi:signal transduction histidine kinase
MFIYFLLTVLITIVSVLNFLVIKKKSISSNTKIAYTIISLSLLLWQITLVYFTFITDYAFLHRLTFFFAIWLILGWLMIAIYYPKRKAGKKEKFVISSSFLLSAVVSFLLLGTDLIIQDYILETGEVVFTKAQYFFFLFILIEIIYLIIKFYFRFKKEKESRLYFKYIFFATAFYAFSGLIFNLSLPLLGYQNYSIVGSFIGLIPTIAVFYTIYAKRVFSTKFIIGKFYYYVINIFLITIMLSAFFYFLSGFQQDYKNLEFAFIIVISAIVFLIATENLRRFLNSLLKNYFLENTYRYENIQQELLDKTKGNLTFKDISNSLSKFLAERVGIEEHNLILIERGKIIFSKNSKDENLIKSVYSKINLISQDTVSVIAESIPEEILTQSNYKTLISLKENGTISAIILLAEKENKEPLTLEEVILLETSMRILNLTLSRAKLFKEVQDLNSSLKQKVSDQTQELRQKVKQLEAARRKEADMIDIMGHELRTPMSVVKLNTDLLSNFSENIMKRREDFTKYVKRIKDAVDTEIKLINTLLSSAKLEGDKIELNPEKVDIVEQIKMAIHAQESRAKRKGLEIKTNFSPGAHNVYADHARTIEILNNLIDNAVKYTEQGSVTVTTKEEGEFVRISVIDTGHGLSEEDIAKLGTKFFRTSTYIESEDNDDIDIVRPGGTGLGLYVTFNLIRKMGGEIHVESEKDKGSIFTFTLPKYTNQKSTGSKESNDMFERMGLKKEEES